MLTLLVLALLFGKAIVTYGPSFPVVNDSLDYLEIARSIPTGSYPSIDDHIYPPGYPAFLASVFAIVGESASVVHLVQFLLVGGIAALTYLIAYRHLGVGPLFALGAGLIVLFWPYFTLYALLRYSEVLYSFLLALALLFLLEGLHRDRWGWFAGAGLTMGVAALVRPVGLLLPFWIVGFVVLACLYRRQLTRWWRQIGIGVTAFLLALAPWSLFIYTQTGIPMPVSTHFSTVYDRTVNLTYEPWRESADTTAKPVSDLVQSKLLNVLRVWNPGAGGTQAESLIERIPAARYAIYLYFVGFFVILALAALSLRFPPARGWILFCAILYVWAVHTVLYPYPRYTLPIIPLVIMLAAYTAHRAFLTYTTQRPSS